MFVIHNIQHTKHSLREGVIAMGKFDGLHLGHQYLLRHSQKLAEEHNLPLVILVLTINNSQPVLTTPETKIQILRRLLPNAHIIFHDLTKDYESYKPQKFINNVIHTFLQPKFIVVGEDFQFGYQRSGNVSMLQHLSSKYGYHLEVIPLQGPVCQNQDTCATGFYKSTIVRNCIAEGNMKLAHLMLGRHWWVDGVVVPGAKDLNICHSANLDIRQYVSPKPGVYIAYSKIMDTCTGPWYPSVAYFGYAATTLNRAEPLLEAHLLRQNLDLYHRHLRVVFLDFLRDDKKFSCREILNYHINNDILNAELAFKEIEINLSEYE